MKIGVLMNVQCPVFYLISKIVLIKRKSKPIQSQACFLIFKISTDFNVCCHTLFQVPFYPYL